MPPIRKKDPLKSAQIEGKIELAISDLKNGRIRSIREAARIYTIPRTTLQDRLNGIIQEHFDRVQAAISKYGILPEDIYNFDETGFTIGLYATIKPLNLYSNWTRTPPPSQSSNI
uniref:HTH psq-type domain-containing protein n=1 Tax=Talaromyces marneffei PM1 TaxID=1077442 RepID=A0A093Y7T1_TALMA